MSKHKPVILFFLANGGQPTEDELEFIKKGRAEGVVIAPRNRLFVTADHKPEPHDAVHAFDPEHVPAIYAESKKIDEALKEFLAEKEARRKLVGDDQAPPPPEVKKPAAQPKPDPSGGGWKNNK